MAKIKALLGNRTFCMAWLIFSLAYVTVFGLLYVDDPFAKDVVRRTILGIAVDPTMRATASVIGKYHFWGFKLWGVFQQISLALNVLYLYKRYDFQGKMARAGRICLIIATGFILMCISVPSTEEFGLQLVAHWSGALLFGAFNAAAIALFLLGRAKRSKRILATLIVFLGMLASMITLLAILGKSGAIENIPMWGAYLILFLLNFTGLYKKSLPA